MPPKPPAIAELVWRGDLRFDVTFGRERPVDSPGAAPSGGHPPLVIDSSSVAGPSPIDALVAATAGCMSLDLVHILNRGRHTFAGLRSRLVSQRSPDHPHRLTSIALHFVIEGDVSPEVVQRAITLSREKYCSVWHSLRQDISLDVHFDIVSAAQSHP